MAAVSSLDVHNNDDEDFLKIQKRTEPIDMNLMRMLSAIPDRYRQDVISPICLHREEDCLKRIQTEINHKMRVMAYISQVTSLKTTEPAFFDTGSILQERKSGGPQLSLYRNIGRRIENPENASVEVVYPNDKKERLRLRRKEKKTKKKAFERERNRQVQIVEEHLKEFAKQNDSIIANAHKAEKAEETGGRQRGGEREDKKEPESDVVLNVREDENQDKVKSENRTENDTVLFVSEGIIPDEQIRKELSDGETESNSTENKKNDEEDVKRCDAVTDTSPVKVLISPSKKNPIIVETSPKRRAPIGERVPRKKRNALNGNCLNDRPSVKEDRPLPINSAKRKKCWVRAVELLKPKRIEANQRHKLYCHSILQLERLTKKRICCERLLANFTEDQVTMQDRTNRVIKSALLLKEFLPLSNDEMNRHCAAWCTAKLSNLERLLDDSESTIIAAVSERAQKDKEILILLRSLSVDKKIFVPETSESQSSSAKTTNVASDQILLDESSQLEKVGVHAAEKAHATALTHPPTSQPPATLISASPLTTSHIPPKLFLVIDLEALVFSPEHAIVEQVGFIIVDQWCHFVSGGKFIVRQVISENGLQQLFPGANVPLAIENYKRCTGDMDYIHCNEADAEWEVIRTLMVQISRTIVCATFAKGAALEQLLFRDDIYFIDLKSYRCPRYPYALHDPADECRFFALFIPFLMNSPQCRMAGEEEVSHVLSKQR